MHLNFRKFLASFEQFLSLYFWFCNPREVISLDLSNFVVPSFIYGN